MQRILIIGATGVMGTAATQAVRERFGSDAEITGLWYGREDNPPETAGIDRLLFADIGDDGAIDAIISAAGSDFDWCFYATALGDVGFPVTEATAEQITASNRLSVDPLASLESQLNIGTLVSYSTFYNLPHQRITYGAMGHSKHALECWTLEPGSSRHRCIRAAAFASDSSKGIKLLIRRRAKQLAASDEPLLREIFSGEKPSVAVDRLQDAVFAEERELLGDSGTDLDALTAAHLRLLEGIDEPFLNVAGQRIWTSDSVLELR